MNLLDFLLRGRAVLSLRSAAPETLLNRLSRSGIPFWGVVRAGSYTLRLCCYDGDAEKIRSLAGQSQAEAELVRSFAGIRAARRLVRRPVLMLGILFALFSVLYFPQFVWTVTVSGNETVPTEEILRAVDDLGVHFGARTRSIRSQEIKDRLLNRVEGLQWAAVNCSGGLCQVLVRERIAAPPLADRRQPADVVASRAGTVVSMRVLDGQPLCAVGDTVAAGQMLVTGCIDWGVKIQNTRAEADVYALTWHELNAVTPDTCSIVSETGPIFRTNYLQLGKLRIKISGSSRIYTAGCDKMIERKRLTLPGGYSFPVVLIRETFRENAVCEASVPEETADALLAEFGTRAVSAEMTDGAILSERSSLQPAAGRYLFSAAYSCREMIARQQAASLVGSE